MLKVAVIGAGAAGLVAARLLSAEPAVFAPPVVFEQAATIGGTWVYTDQVGKDRHGLPIHSSMYRNLRTNLPKEVMGFPDFPFKETSYNGKSFIFHEEVLDYLRSYASEFNLERFISFETRVEQVTPLSVGDPRSGWSITTRNLTTGAVENRHFDALLVCNGHYSVPAVPNIPGLKEFQGEVLHSHDYRFPEPYTGKRIILLGGRASGIDISMEVSKVAKQVYLAHNQPPFPATLPDNMRQTVGIERMDGSEAVLLDGSRVEVDVLMFCTGYEFVFPFLSPECGVSVVDRQVRPLYKHLVHTEYPRMAFVGLPTVVLPFPLFHKQVQFFLASLTGRLQLPSRAEMTEDTVRDLQRRLEMGMPRRYAHFLGPLQWEYFDELAAMSGTAPMPPAVRELYDEVHVQRCHNLSGYKDKAFRITGPDSFVEVTDEVMNDLYSKL
ncbi:flavin-containing monooxygenase FMO GS-OX-like 2 [Amphibalanus amphitrite]|uniref:flavin-containing monooxygenase FMO GS-OX-like 2 n=1 Tax=Amphibalanus amphitrite TaxID=1232801 RepID=UPI001C90F648|nr:flavin-containing monooxygenase FMO GS-OX-like 2 [Amphibalanus amphitrite]